MRCLRSVAPGREVKNAAAGGNRLRRNVGSIFILRRSAAPGKRRNGQNGQ